MEILAFSNIIPATPLASMPCGGATTFRRPQPISAAAKQSPLTWRHQKLTHPMPPEKVEVFKSLEPWASRHVLPLVKPVNKCWQPVEFLPTDDFIDEVKALRDRTIGLPDEYFVVLVGDMITEEALPTYQSMINACDGVREESGQVHARGLLGFGLGLPKKTGMDIGLDNNPYLTFVYTSFQERATFVSHGNTARLAKKAGDPILASMCGSIAADEKRHENAYVRIVEKLLEVDPNETMLAIGNMMRKRITMPGHLMCDGQDPNLFQHFSLVAEQLGVYTIDDYMEILEFLVARWRLEKLDGLKGNGRREQDYVCSLPARMRKLQEQAVERGRKMEPRAQKFSWIFNREVTIQV
ncbi:UNVERIFIED_CONTAM: Stearoyl-[acyl-carrier-protein] 9-desaturase 6, chloroplastic [Sesamum latifolium]|uniref:Stearoyl-[acyl-carrier-protein] 9-desaturase 6, chloroplastic n=1 Tax=Sesamum latifolium TaxID=2727402 RepID=A0AAW2WQP2_9LAMI